MSQFGWIPPDDEKRAQNERYLVRNIFAAPLTVEKEIAYPDYNYDQISGSCTGYSASWAQSIYNTKKYNGMWIYRRGQDTDGDPGTSGDADGGYIWAVFDVLRKEGHALWNTETPIREEGIVSYYWCRTIDEIRSAIDADRVPVFGIYWYEEFQSPRLSGGVYWIGTRAKWGNVLGGHAIACVGASDTKVAPNSDVGAFKLLNTWGREYPPVWVSYKSVGRLMSMRGECAVGLDIKPEPPPPPPEPETKAFVVTFDGVTYAGVLSKK